MGSAVLVAYALWLIFVLTWHLTGPRTSRQVAAAGRSRERLHELFIAGGWALIVLPLGVGLPRLWTNAAPVAWSMLGVIIGGCAFCWWARLHLGRLWSAQVTRRDGHHIVDTGPYGLVRHPIYTGFIVSYIGLALVTASAFAFLAVACFIIGLWLKARLEERFLAEQMGPEAYAEYKNRTPMFVPRRLPSRTPR